MEKRKWRSPLRPEQGPCWWKLKFAVEAPADALLDTLREIVNEGVLLRIPTIGNEASSGYIVGCLGHRLHGTRYGVSMAAQVHSQNSRVWVTRNVLELQTFVGGVVPVWVEARLYDPLYAVFLGRLVKRIASRWPSYSFRLRRPLELSQAWLQNTAIGGRLISPVSRRIPKTAVMSMGSQPQK